MSRLLRSVFGKTLLDSRRALVGYAIGMVALVAMIVSIWPSFADQREEFQRLLESYPPAFRAAFDIGEFDAPGFLKGELFSFMLPLLLLIYGIGRGADVIAGEEERGALDVVLAHPVTRRSVLLQKAAGIAVGLALLCALLFVALAGGVTLMRMEVGVLNIGAAVLMLYLLAVLFAAAALALGAIRARRGAAIGISAAIGAGTYLVLTLSRLVEDIAWAKWASPFHYYGAADPLVNGLDVAHAALLAGLSVALVGLAAWAFDRRDVGT